MKVVAALPRFLFRASGVLDFRGPPVGPSPSGALPVLTALLFFVLKVSLPFLLALFVAYLLEPGVRALERRGLERRRAAQIVYAFFFLLAGLALAAAVFRLDALATGAQSFLHRLAASFEELGDGTNGPLAALPPRFARRSFAGEATSTPVFPSSPSLRWKSSTASGTSSSSSPCPRSSRISTWSTPKPSFVSSPWACRRRGVRRLPTSCFASTDVSRATCADSPTSPFWKVSSST